MARIFILWICSIFLVSGCDSPDEKYSENTHIEKNESQRLPKEYKIGGVQIRIGDGFLSLFQEGFKYPGDTHSRIYYRFKINPDGSYFYYNDFGVHSIFKSSYNAHKVYTYKGFMKEKTDPKENWTNITIFIDVHMTNPNSKYTSYPNFEYLTSVRFDKDYLKQNDDVYGLVFFKPDFKELGDFFISFFPNTENVETLIRCTHGVDEKYHSICEQHFNIPKTNLVVIMSYRKYYMQYWRFMQNVFIKAFNEDIMIKKTGE